MTAEMMIDMLVAKPFITLSAYCARHKREDKAAGGVE
jgi:hypothetical protein